MAELFKLVSSLAVLWLGIQFCRRAVPELLGLDLRMSPVLARFSRELLAYLMILLLLVWLLLLLKGQPVALAALAKAAILAADGSSRLLGFALWLLNSYLLCGLLSRRLAEPAVLGVMRLWLLLPTSLWFWGAAQAGAVMLFTLLVLCGGSVAVVATGKSCVPRASW